MHTVASIALAAAFAGAVAVAVTVAIERWGGLLGGFLGTLPTTIVPAALGIAATSPEPEGFRSAMFVAPAGMCLNAGFLFLWRVLPPRLPLWPLRVRLAVMTALSLSAWIVCAAALVVGVDALRSSSVRLDLFGGGITLLLAATGVLACLRHLPSPRGQRRVGGATLAARGLLAAVSIGLSVFLASAGGPLVASVAAVFPAIFLTTMVSLWLAQGEAVPVGAVGPMMLGSTSVATYAMLAAFTIPAWGAAFGSLSAWLLAAGCVTAPASWWLHRRRARQALSPRRAAHRA